MPCEACLQPFELTTRPSDKELLAILRLPFVPYGANLEAVEEDIADANSELERLEEEIARTLARARRLKSQRHPIKAFLALKKAVFAPIRQLPTEILLEIFSIVSSTVTITSTAGFPWRLAHVCGRWRDVALSSPALWSSIDLGFPDKQVSKRRATQACQVLKLCLTRSREQPLSIRLWAHQRNTTITRDILNIALQVRDRWKELDYSCGSWACQTPFDDSAFLPPTLDLPMLRHLVLCPSRHSKFSLLAPGLTSLNFTPSTESSLQTLTQVWPRITCLRLSLRIDRDDVARTLLQLPELSELDIACVFQTDSSSIPVHLNRLLTLTIALENPIITNLTTPNLRTLLVRGKHSSTPSESLSSGQIVTDLLQRSSCSITRLVLFGWYFSNEDLVGIIGLTPNVKQLDMLITKRSTLWQHLMYKGDLTLLPRLHTLNLGLVSLPECKDVVQVVKSRAVLPLNPESHNSSLNPTAERRLRNLGLHLPRVKKNKHRVEVQLLEQVQGLGGLKVDFDGDLYLHLVT